MSSDDDSAAVMFVAEGEAGKVVIVVADNSKRCSQSPPQSESVRSTTFRGSMPMIGGMETPPSIADSINS